MLAVILTLSIPASTIKAQTANPQEISSSDVEPTFKLQSERNLVLVRVVVRDAKGAAVDNLRQEDFHLFDHGKPQTILHFSMEKPALKSAEPLHRRSRRKSPPPNRRTAMKLPCRPPRLGASWRCTSTM